MSSEIFVDTHCHFFNLIDIPLYETLDGQVSMNTAAKLLAAFSASGLALTGVFKEKIHDYKDFIQFFERPIDENINAFIDEVQAAKSDAKNIIVTPLVMDFDCTRNEQCLHWYKYCNQKECTLTHQEQAKSSDPTVEGQFFRLQEAIQKVDSITATRSDITVKVFPFIGLDLRKLTSKNNQYLNHLKAFWAKVGITKSERQGGFSNIDSGKAIGIKLYPPIGFNPYPVRNREALQYCIEFYEWCIEEQIPITVHCQSGSYSAGRKKGDVNADTHARNWLNLFTDWKAGKLNTSSDIDQLRINFAHFGGENGLEDMLDPWRIFGGNGIDEKSWTYVIVKLLQTHPNTFSDLSAFDWSNNNARDNFATLLEISMKGELGSGAYAVTDKLLWGSDVPMILDSDSYKEDGQPDGKLSYKNLYDNFTDTVFEAELENRTEKLSVINNMTSNTPIKFLFDR